MLQKLSRKSDIFKKNTKKKISKKKISSKKIQKSKLVNFRFQLDWTLGFRVRGKNWKFEKAGRTLPTVGASICFPSRSSSLEMLLLQLPKRKWAGVQLQLLLKVSSKTNIQSRPVQALYWTWPGLLWSQWPGIFVHSCNNCLRSKQLLQEWTNIPGHWLGSRPGQVQYRACTGLDWIFVLLDTFKRSCSWTPAHFLFGSWRSNISREELLCGKFKHS